MLSQYPDYPSGCLQSPYSNNYGASGSDRIFALVDWKSPILFVFLISVITSVHAKEVDVCNTSPLELYVAVGLVSDIGTRKTYGWYEFEPGRCMTWNTQGSSFYYYAESFEKLAYWLNDGDPYKLNGWFNYLCVDPENSFEMPAKGTCQKKYSFKRASLRQDITSINLYEENHKGIALEDAKSLRRTLIGRMDYESMLRNQEGREPPFQIGIGMDNSAWGDGVLVKRIFQGMPAESEGLEVNDKIVGLNGYRIEDRADFTWVLDNVSIFQSTPLSITITRDGIELDGSIEPLFFPFNHPEYNPNEKVDTFLWSMADGAAFGFGNEILCGSLNIAVEGLRALPEDRDFNGKQVSEDISSCSNNLNRKMQKKIMLYEDASIAGYWASIAVPSLPLAKILKVNKAIPLAARSRKVGRTPLTRSFSN